MIVVAPARNDKKRPAVERVEFSSEAVEIAPPSHR